jgi:hypothetical protein
MRKLLGFSVTCLLISLLLVACADNLSPAEAGQRYLEAVRDANYGAAYELLTSDSQLKISKADFGDRLARARQDATIVRTEIIKVNRDATIVGKRASVTYQLEVSLQNGQKLSLFESMVLLQQENGWRVIWPPQ